MNILAILVAALVAFVLGFLWHGPLFGKTWMRLANVTSTGNEKLSDMWPQMIQNYISNVVTAVVLSGLIIYTASLATTESWCRGAVLAICLWLGFVATSSAPEVIWMKRPVKLWLFELSSSLISLAVMGAILAAWR